MPFLLHTEGGAGVFCWDGALALVDGEGVFRVEQVVPLRRPDAQRDGVLKHGENLHEGAPHQLRPLPYVELITCTHVILSCGH